MAVYQVLELFDTNNNPTGLFHYTCTDGCGTRAIGYCNPIELCPECPKDSWMYPNTDCKICNGKGIVRKQNPCIGHSSREEAYNHYKEYVIDNTKFDEIIEVWPKYKCDIKECSNQATYNTRSVDNYVSYNLCSEHANKLNLWKLYE